MKKLFLMLAAGFMAVSVNAQNTTITANKAGDNWYIGANAGVSTYLKEQGGKDGFFKSLAPTFGVRVGKNLTTVFGLAFSSQTRSGMLVLRPSLRILTLACWVLSTCQTSSLVTKVSPVLSR